MSIIVGGVISVVGILLSAGPELAAISGGIYIVAMRTTLLHPDMLINRVTTGKFADYVGLLFGFIGLSVIFLVYSLPISIADRFVVGMSILGIGYTMWIFGTYLGSSTEATSEEELTSTFLAKLTNK